jgi:hypothetical protein
MTEASTQLCVSRMKARCWSGCAVASCSSSLAEMWVHLGSVVLQHLPACSPEAQPSCRTLFVLISHDTCCMSCLSRPARHAA